MTVGTTTTAGAFAAAIFLVASGASAADANAPLEGQYDLGCDVIELDASVSGIECGEGNANTLLCVMQANPFHFQFEDCGRGDLMGRAEEVYSACVDALDLTVRNVEGEVMLDAGEALCNMTRAVLQTGATGLEGSLNGTFDVDIAGSTWVSRMSGKFSSDNGLLNIDLPYAILNFPLSREAGFLFTSGAPFNVELTGVCEDGKGLASITSGGEVQKVSKNLVLWYNGQVQTDCSLPTGEGVRYIVNLYSRGSGTKR